MKLINHKHINEGMHRKDDICYGDIAVFIVEVIAVIYCIHFIIGL